MVGYKSHPARNRNRNLEEAMKEEELKAEREAMKAALDQWEQLKPYHDTGSNCFKAGWRTALAWQKSQQAVVSPAGWREGVVQRLEALPGMLSFNHGPEEVKMILPSKQSP